MQSFDVDNRATDDWPADRLREVTITIRLLRGYDADFGQAIIIVWVQEVVVKLAVAIVVDTRWETRATVLNDIKINHSISFPFPNQHKTNYSEDCSNTNQPIS